MTRKKSYCNIATLIIIAMSTSIQFFLDDRQMNYLLIVVMTLSPLVIFNIGKTQKSDLLGLLLLCTMFLCTYLFHPGSFRASTIIYSALFIFTFIAYNRVLLTNRFSPNHYLKLLRWLLYAYFFMLIVQQLCVLIGINPINTSVIAFEDKWKLSSLAAEPSHASRFVLLFMFSFISVKSYMLKRKYILKVDGKKDKYVWFVFFWVMLTSGSGTAIILLPIVLFQVLNIRNFIPLFLFILGVSFLINIEENKAASRSFDTILATLTLDEDKIIEADHSAALRIVPIMMSLKLIDLTDSDTWFGHGIDYIKATFYLKFPGVPEGTSGGGMPTFIVEYGLLSFVLFAILSFQMIDFKNGWNALIFIIIVLAGTMNSQITWAAIIFLSTNKYFKDRIEKQSFRLNQKSKLYYNVKNY
jgi:hypothetical protein